MVHVTAIENWLLKPDNQAARCLLLDSWATKNRDVKRAYHTFFHDREVTDEKLHGIGHNFARDCLKRVHLCHNLGWPFPTPMRPTKPSSHWQACPATLEYKGCIGIMEKKMETTLVYWGYIVDI